MLVLVLMLALFVREQNHGSQATEPHPHFLLLLRKSDRLPFLSLSGLVFTILRG
jgi:hypothetical protein